jgi:hypothetical protein
MTNPHLRDPNKLPSPLVQPVHKLGLLAAPVADPRFGFDLPRRCSEVWIEPQSKDPTATKRHVGSDHLLVTGEQPLRNLVIQARKTSSDASKRGEKIWLGRLGKPRLDRSSESRGLRVPSCSPRDCSEPSIIDEDIVVGPYNQVAIRLILGSVARVAQTRCRFEQATQRQITFISRDYIVRIICTIIVYNQQFPLDVRWDAEFPHFGQCLVEKPCSIPGANRDCHFHRQRTLSELFLEQVRDKIFIAKINRAENDWPGAPPVCSRRADL